MRGLLRLPPMVLTLTALAPLAGCSSSSRDAAELTDSVQVAQVISSLEDVKNNPKLLAGWFAEGAAPPAAELRKFAKFGDFRASGKPTVSGETATAKVRVLGGNGQEVGTADWTLVKEGGRWKLKSAPLP